MKTVGAGVNEIRIRDAIGGYRVIYLAARAEAVYVLHYRPLRSRGGLKQMTFATIRPWHPTPTMALTPRYRNFVDGRSRNETPGV